MELFPFIFFCLISPILVFSSLLSSLFRLRSNVFLSFQKLFEKWEEECKNTPEGQPLPPRPKVSLLSLTSTLFHIFRFKPLDSLSFLPLLLLPLSPSLHFRYHITFDMTSQQSTSTDTTTILWLRRRSCESSEKRKLK